MMIDVFQRGGDKKDHPILKRAAKFFAEELFSDELLSQLILHIRIQHTPSMYDGYFSSSKTLIGYRLKTLYEVTLSRKLTLDDKISTMAHELVHIDQVESGRFVVKSWKRSGVASTVEWGGVTLYHVDDTPYGLQPWEAEANRLEKQLFRSWLKITKAYG